MFCANCGTKIEENSKFCHNCGNSVINDLPTLKNEKQLNNEVNATTNDTRETAEEYLAKTDIKNVEEAKKYLGQLKALFWIVFLSMVVIRGLGESESELAVILFIPYIGLLIYFIYFCVKVLKAEKLPKANALWCVVFAPISWLYLYPSMADPLKIILGKKQPPIRLSDSERKQKRTEANKKFWRKFWIIVGAVVGIFAIALVAIYYLT
ncbi:zinc-ribbon domain-containing protein [Candidatus Parcubacteria bacterium]|nr:zinc-ribbon domain-containing protein [Candidatus Parcubacteria bacterium]